MPAAWTVRFGDLAYQDYLGILNWTKARFGGEQTLRYADLIKAVVDRLEAGPAALGARRREDIGPGLWTLGIARRGQRGRHFLLYRIESEGVIEILRVLHDSMDIGRHLS